MNEKDDNKWLENILINESDYIDDNGFTENIISHLPQVKKKLSSGLRTLIISITTLVSITILIWVMPGFQNFYMNILLSISNNSWQLNTGIIVMLSLGISSISYLIADYEL